MLEVGSVIIVKNQIFNKSNNRNNEKSRIDYKKFRPAIIIAESEDNFYYLTETSTKGKSNKQFEYITQNDKVSYVTLENIYVKPIFGGIEKDFLNDETLYELLVKFYEYQKSLEKPDPLFKEIEILILNKTKQLALKQQKHKE